MPITPRPAIFAGRCNLLYPGTVDILFARLDAGLPFRRALSLCHEAKDIAGWCTGLSIATCTIKHTFSLLVLYDIGGTPGTLSIVLPLAVDGTNSVFLKVWSHALFIAICVPCLNLLMPYHIPRLRVRTEQCEVVAPFHRRGSHSTVKLYGTPLKEVHRYKYLGLPFGAKGLDTGRMCEVSIAKGICTASLFHSIGCNGGGFSPAVCRRVLTSFVQPSMEYGMALVNLRKGEQVAVDNAWFQILSKTLSMPATACGSAILKVLGVPPMTFRASKLNVGFMARIYDAQPDALTPLVEDKRDCNARRISQGV